MEDVDRGLTLTSLGSEGNEIKQIASATSATATCTTTTEGGIDRSMVIYVQEEQQELPVSSLTAARSSNSTEQQLITLVPQVCSTVFLTWISFQVTACMMSLFLKI
jgi:hypothetical protein